MRRSAVLAITAAVLVATVVVGSFVTGVVPIAQREAPPAPTPHVSGSSPKTVVFEFGTGTWCPPCANADPAIGRIADEYDPSDLIILAYHVSGTDPWRSAVTSARLSFYGMQWVPTTVVDGGFDLSHWQVGASGSKAANYDGYRDMIDPDFPSGSNVMITLEGDLKANTAFVNATITATDIVDPFMYPNLNVRFVLYEDSVYYMGTNGEPFHRGVVLDLKEHPGFTISQGETKYVTDTFTLRSESAIYSRNKLGVAVLLQSDTRTPIMIPGYDIHYYSEILNAARLDFVTPGIVAYQDNGVTDYSEPLERLLSKGLHHFRTWDDLSVSDTGANDIRGPPDAAGLAAYPMVAWFTGSAATGTLTAQEQTLLEGQLSGGAGDLLLTGENIGADIGTSTFYQNVLKASYAGDDGTATGVRGVAGDPVTDSWSSTTMLFVGSSPDIVNPGTGASTMFTYVPGGGSAAVRSDYDSDSRVGYLGFRIFEWYGSGQASDLDPNNIQRTQVLTSAVSWFDATVPPAVTVGYANGGEVFVPGTNYKLTWTATDVEIPADGVDIYYTADSGSPTWVLIAANEPNDGVYNWTAPAGVDSDRCRLKVVVRDGQGNAGEDISNADFTIGTPSHETFILTLQPGRNLASFALDPSDNSIAGIFAGIDPDYAWVRAYDASTPSDPWNVWYRGGPPPSLTSLDRTQGFWIEVTSATPVTVTIQGLGHTSTTISLVAGWNLVGCPTKRTDITVASVMAATGATMITGPDPTSPTGMKVLAGTDTLTAGNGYWIYVNAPASWVVPYT